MTTIINLTAHPINLRHNDNVDFFLPSVIAPSGFNLRVTYDIVNVSSIGDYPLRALKPNGLVLAHNQTNDTQPMPDQKNGVFYAVSALAYIQAAPLGRTDLICPDTDIAEKNEKGHVLSVPGFARYI